MQIEVLRDRVCGQSHSNSALTVVWVFQTGFAREIRYVDDNQACCVLGTYRRHHRGDGTALSDDQLGRAICAPSGAVCSILTSAWAAKPVR